MSLRPGHFEADQRPRVVGELSYVGPLLRACLLEGPRPMIVALEPEARSDPHWPLCHEVGAALAKVVGIPQAALILRADAAHVRALRLPKSRTGHAIAIVSDNAAAWLIARARGPIVVLGKAVAEFELRCRELPSRTVAGSTYRLTDGRELTVLPCPRRQAYWYTRSTNREQARATLRVLLGLEPACLTLQ